MLNSIRLRNLRSFNNEPTSPFIELKPLTVFVGKNSCGKSTCLRSLPLLRQSVEARTTGPILWYGSYVDFGAFSEAVTKDSNTNVIYFDFLLELDTSQERYPTAMFSGGRRFRSAYESNNVIAQVQLGVTDVDNKTIASSLKIKINNFDYDFEFSENGKCTLSINNEAHLELDNLDSFQHRQLLPVIGKIRERDRTIDGVKRTHRFWDESYFETFFTQKLKKKLSPFFHSNTSEQKINSGIQRIGIIERKKIRKSISSAFNSSNSFLKNVKNISESDLDDIHALSMHKNISRILSIVDGELSSVFKRIRYIAPLRATAERYYRHQDLQIEEIDHTGSNLAMLLKSWTTSEQRKFGDWTMSSFGFKVRVNESGLHYALMVQTKGDDKEYNINDMGFGFSQILPIVASLWLETLNTRRTRRGAGEHLIFAIEQPELHLHPEYQSKLATVFSKIISQAKTNGIGLKIIFETHSKTMIDTIGDNIEDGEINKEDVNIVLFDKCLKTNSSLVKFANYDEEGNLDNWHIGFFSGRV